MSLTRDDVRRRMAELLGVPRVRATDETALTDLVPDSFRLVEMAIELQEEYDVIIGQADLKLLRTVGQLAELVRSRFAG